MQFSRWPFYHFAAGVIKRSNQVLPLLWKCLHYACVQWKNFSLWGTSTWTPLGLPSPDRLEFCPRQRHNRDLEPSLAWLAQLWSRGVVSSGVDRLRSGHVVCRLWRDWFTAGHVVSSRRNRRRKVPAVASGWWRQCRRSRSTSRRTWVWSTASRRQSLMSYRETVDQPPAGSQSQHTNTVPHVHFTWRLCALK